MGTELRNGESLATSRSIPTTGMRGGLGRTFLTALLVLTILPLALIGWYAVQQNRLNLQREVENKLQAVAILKAQELRLWLEDRETLLFSPENFYSATGRVPQRPSWELLQQRDAGLRGATLLDENGYIVWTVGTCPDGAVASDLEGVPDMTVALSLPRKEGNLLLCYRLSALEQTMRADVSLGGTTQIYMVQNDTIWSRGAAERAMPWGASGYKGDQVERHVFYVSHTGIPVMGAYYPLPDLDLGILVEQEQSEVLASSDRIAATLIAVILAVVLVTTAIASMVIRRITRPVIWLTESALEMAEGNLDQHIMVTSKDEIGILTYVFNKMAAELKSLYDDLEAKVVKRTRMLQQVNYQIQRRALHLEASLEVSRAITSVRDPAMLLNRVAELIAGHFLYASVAVYLLEPGGGQARLHAVSPAKADWPAEIHAGDGSLLERSLRKAEPQIQSEPILQGAWYQRTLSRVVIPLKMEKRVLGALGVLSAEREGVQEDELKVLVHLANQVSIALENAQAYERERMAAQKLEEAEVFKDRFLSNMSHELREPLNSIIGFSRLMLKGLDGPLSEQQIQDLHRVYSNSQHLLGLINDLLAISQLRAGLMELRLSAVDLREIMIGVMPTASALIRGKDIELIQEIEEDLPLVWADPDRLRQIMVHLLNNAAKFTEQGQIVIRAWTDDELLYVSVSDTGLGVPLKDRDRIFVGFDKGTGERSSQGAGLGLALSREFVELHGGQFWLESMVGKGSTFTFSLPLHAPMTHSESTAAEVDSVVA
ncbi:MAG: ATP-binding protein [Anaerolineae bacterium]|nr:ATP-binding protein [Anaerolineae bacterium]